MKLKINKGYLLVNKENGAIWDAAHDYEDFYTLDYINCVSHGVKAKSSQILTSKLHPLWLQVGDTVEIKTVGKGNIDVVVVDSILYRKSKDNKFYVEVQFKEVKNTFTHSHTLTECELLVNKIIKN